MRVHINYLKLFFLGGLSIVMASCNLSNSEEFEETYTYSFQHDKQIAVDTTSRQVSEDSTQTILSVSSQSGNNLVFHYEKRVTAPPEVMDGGSISTVYFQIPPEIDQFKFEGAELTHASVYFQRSCFCPIIGALKVESGIIEGQKLSETVWTVSASLQPKGPESNYDIKFEGVFNLNNSQE